MSDGELIRRGRSIGVRIKLRGERKWLGTIRMSCERCDGLPAMCRSCKAKAELEAEQRIAQAKRVHLFNRETCEEFGDRWTTDYSNGGRRWDDSTLDLYATVLKSFNARFGSRPLAEITRRQARDWANQVPLTYVRTLAAMFNDALRDELIPANPFTGLRLDADKGRSDIIAITEEELHLLADIAQTEWGAVFSAMVAMAGYTAIRTGELFALEPHHISIEEQEMKVRQQWTGRALKRPKDKEPRKVWLPSEVRPFLADVPRHLTTLKVPVQGQDERATFDPLFRNTNSRPWRNPALSMAWKPVRARFEGSISEARRRELREANQGKPMPFYALRHFGATMILRRGGTIDDVRQQLGHADGSKATLVYTHLEESYKLERLKRLDKRAVPELRSVESEAADG